MKVTIELELPRDADALRKILKALNKKSHADERAKRVQSDNLVRSLGMSTYTTNCLIGAGISTIDQLVTLSDLDLLKLPNFGKKALKETKAALADVDPSLNNP